MGRQGPRDSAGTTHIYERFLGEQFPPLDAGRNCPVERTHGPVRQRCGPHAGEQRAREMQIHFCELLMPDSLKDYYTDSFELTGQAGCEQKLAFFGLINLDEYDRLSPQKLPLLKKSDADAKNWISASRNRSSYSHLPRMASFIGTSNRKALLTDPSGSRRYFFAEVKEKIDCSPLEHKQLFAQLKAELDEGKRYWFSAEEESELKLRNQAYYALPTEAEMILHCFRLPEKGEDFKLYSAVCLFNILLKRYPAAMRGITINKMGRIMNSLGAERMHTTTGNMYKLVALAG